MYRYSFATNIVYPFKYWYAKQRVKVYRYSKANKSVQTKDNAMLNNL